MCPQIIRNLEPNCQYSSCSSSSSSTTTIVTKSSQPPQNLRRPLITFACVSLRYRQRCGVGGVGIVVVVCGNICGKFCGKMCGKIEKLSDWNKNWCGSRYGPHDYNSGDKKAKRQKGKQTKRQKCKKTKSQKVKKTKRQRGKKTK